MSEAENIETGTEPTVTEAEPIEETTSTAAVTEPFSVKQKRQATPKQLEALRLARVKKQENAAARKMEYERLAHKISVEQNSDSDSETEYIIKRVKKGKKVAAKEEKDEKSAASPLPRPIEPIPAVDTGDDDTSDDDNRPRDNSKKKGTAKRPITPEFTLNFV